MNKKNIKKRKNNKKAHNLVINIVFILVLLLGSMIFTNYHYAKKEIKTNEIIVENNDTIWSLAKEICKEKQDLNIQNVIIEIKEMNHLESSDIYIGQVLNIPIY